MMYAMGRRVIDVLAAGSTLMVILAIAVGVRSLFWSDAVVMVVGSAFVRVDSLPGKLRVEWAPNWPYPEQVARGWTSWRYGPDQPAPTLGAGSTNALGFGYDRYVTVVMSGEEDETGTAESVMVTAHSVILPLWAIVVAAGVLPALCLMRRFRRRRASAEPGPA